MYTERLVDLERLRAPVVRPDVTMSWFVYVVTLSTDVDRQAVVESLASEGIPTRAYFPPLHLQPYMRERFGTRKGTLPVTEDIASRTLALPFHNNLAEAEVEHVTDALQRALSK
jgi:perosamine synthetase